MKKKKINETATYNVLSKNEGEFDDMHDSIYATQSGYPKAENPGLSSTLYEEDDELGDEEDEMGEIPGEGPPEPPPEGDDSEMGPTEDEKSVNELQNEIIRHNIDALKSIRNEIESLNNTVTGLNSRLDNLDKDVEEVREPTNVEKMVKQKDVSYPYYFNLNDFWKGNWFDEKYGGGEQIRDDGNESTGGIKKLPDGTYVADLDDLPDKSFIDIEKSFHDII